MGTLKDALAAINATAQFYEEMQAAIDDLTADEKSEEQAISALEKTIHVCADRFERGRELAKQQLCPTCGQDARKISTAMRVTAKQELQAEQKKLEHRSGILASLRAKLGTKEHKLESYQEKKRNLERDIETGQVRIADLKRHAAEERVLLDALEVKRKAKEHELALRSRYHQARSVRARR